MIPEVIVSIGAAALSVQLSRAIVVDPLNRVGQVSGVAGLDVRYLLLALVVVGACLLAEWRGGPAWPVVRRCAYAAVAGLTTGLIAGGILLALRGTDWPLFANDGDSGQLMRWADSVIAGRPIPADYPPAIIHNRERGKYIAALNRADRDNDIGALAELLARSLNDSINRFLLPALAGPHRLLPLSALATERLAGPALRLAAERGRLRAQRQGSRWYSTKQWVDEYAATKYRRRAKPGT